MPGFWDDQPTSPGGSSSGKTPSGGSSSGSGFWGSGGASPAAQSGGKGHGFLGSLAAKAGTAFSWATGVPTKGAQRIAGDIGDTVQRAPAALLETTREALRQQGVTATHGTTHGALGLLENLVVPDTSQAGKPHGALQKVVAFGTPNAIAKPLPGETQEQAQARQFPALAGIAQGFKTTGNEVVHPTQAVANYRRDPVGSFLNDAATVSTVFGGAGSVLGKAAGVADSAGLASAAERLGQVGSAAGHVASAPLKPFEFAGKLPRLIGARGYDAAMAAAAEGRSPGRLSALTLKLSPQMKAATDVTLGGSAAEAAARGTNARLGLAAARILPGVDEQAAAAVVAENVAPALAAVRARLSPEDFARHIEDRFKGTITPRAANLAADLAEGKNPELAAQVQAYLAKFDEGLGHPGGGGFAARDEAFLAAHPHQAGYTIDPAALDEARAHAAATSPIGIEQRARALAEQDLTSAPARLRPMLAENRAAAVRLGGKVEGLPTRLSDAEWQGADAAYLPHTQDRSRIPLPVDRGGQSLPRTFTPGSAKLREGSPVYDRTVHGLVKGVNATDTAAIRRRTAEQVAQLPYAAKLGEGPLAGARTAEDAARRGYVAWNPDSPFDTSPVAAGSQKLTFLPKPVFDELRNYYAPRRGQGLGLVTDVPNRIYSIGKLALSPALITGRLFGHGVLAAAGTSDIGAFGRNLIETVKDYRASGGKGERTFAAIREQPRLGKGGSAAAELARLKAEEHTGRAGIKGKVDTAVRGLNQAISKPFHAAEFLDNVQRSAFYMTELQKSGNPEAAITAALRATGEFDRMSPTERDYVRRVVPYWAWHRELTKIAFHLAEDHPLRVAWTLHLAKVAGEPDQPWPAFDQASAPVGKDSILSTRFLMPFSEVGDTFGGGAKGVGRMLGPVPKLAYSSLFNQKPSTGKDYFRPKGTPTQNRHPAPPSLLHQVGQMFPQTRVLDAARGKDRVVRYDSGEPYVNANGDTLPANSSGMTHAVLSFLGADVTSKSAAEAQQARTLAKAGKGATKKPAATGFWGS